MQSAFSRRLLDRLFAVGLFLAAAALYIWSCGPGLTAYRDTGEMAVALSTLGVAHPPGYPLYIVIGSIFTHLTPGALALRANYFSAVCAAATVCVLYLFLRRWCGRPAAAFGAVLLMLYRPFWELATVSEMYALGALWIILLFDAVLVRKNAPLAGLLFGLGLGVRMDILIMAPAIFLPFTRDRRTFLHAVGFAALGMTIFLFMLVRSQTEPWIDWGNPETLSALWRSLSRQSYGGSLDLLSRAYGPGENLASSWLMLGGSLWRAFGIAGFLSALVGVLTCMKDRTDVCKSSIIAFLLTGPVFLFLANLPPNPHAQAILEAAFVTPAIFVVILASVGLEWIATRAGARRRLVWVAAAALFVFLHDPLYAAPKAIKRNAWALRDYSESLFRSAPRSAVVALREDVQLFGAWKAQLLEGRRPDLTVIAVGLSGSDWYWRMLRRWPVAPVPPFYLKSPQGWTQLIHGPRPIMAGYETDVPPESGAVLSPHGFLRRVTPNREAAVDADFLSAVSLFRDATVRYPADFFTADLRADAARAFESHAIDALGTPDTAERFLRKAQALDPDLPAALSDRAFLALQGGRYPDALALYGRTAEVERELLRKAAVYKSLPEVTRSIERGLADAIVHQGVVHERMGQLEEARARYRESIDVIPTSIAYYNLGVTYWNRDWPKAVENFERAVALDPTSTQAATFLERARRGGRG